MEKRKEKKEFKRVILKPLLYNPLFHREGWKNIHSLVQNLANPRFRSKFFKTYSETLLKPSDSAEKFIDNLIFIFSMNQESLQDSYEEIRSYLIENLILLKDEETGRTFSRRFYHKFKDYDDIWL